MDRIFRTLVIALALINGIYMKELHVKEDLIVDDKEVKEIMNLLNNDDSFTNNKRFARHLESVTETVLEHFISELKHQYGNSATHKTPMMNLFKRIKNQLKRNKQKRIMMKNKKKNKKKYKGRLGKLTTEKKKGKNWRKL